MLCQTLCQLVNAAGRGEEAWQTLFKAASQLREWRSVSAIGAVLAARHVRLALHLPVSVEARLAAVTHPGNNTLRAWSSRLVAEDADLAARVMTGHLVCREAAEAVAFWRGACVSIVTEQLAVLDMVNLCVRSPDQSWHGAVCATGRYLVSAGDEAVDVLSSPALVHQRRLHQHAGQVSLLSVVDADRIIAVTLDSRVRVWSLRAGTCVFEYLASCSVVSVAVLDPSRILVCTQDHDLRCVSLARGCVTMSCTLPVPVLRVMLVPTAPAATTTTVLLAGKSMTMLWLWDLPTVTHCDNDVAGYDHDGSELSLDEDEGADEDQGDDDGASTDSGSSGSSGSNGSSSTDGGEGSGGDGDDSVSPAQEEMLVEMIGHGTQSHAIPQPVLVQDASAVFGMHHDDDDVAAICVVPVSRSVMASGYLILLGGMFGLWCVDPGAGRVCKVHHVRSSTWLERVPGTLGLVLACDMNAEKWRVLDCSSGDVILVSSGDRMIECCSIVSSVMMA